MVPMPHERAVPPRRWQWQGLSQVMSPPRVQPAKGMGYTAPHQHRLHLEQTSCQRLWYNMLHQHHPCQHHLCPEPMSHQKPACNTLHRHHPNPELVSHQRPGCRKLHQYHLSLELMFH